MESLLSWTSVVLTFAVLLTWLTIAALVLGVGALFLRPSVRLEPAWGDALLAMLCGFAVLFAGLLVWHFFLPANELALLVFAAAGIAGLVRDRAWLLALARTSRSKRQLIPLLILAIWAANHALMRGGWDDYVYEYQVVRWFHDYPIVPGLANLHGRLGFNNAHHLYAAMLSAGPWTGAVNVIVNGLFVGLVLMLSWNACMELLRGRITERAVFTAAFLAPCLARHVLAAELSQPMISTLKADVTGSALSIIAACLWLEFADRTTSELRRKALAITMALTAATLLSIRLGSAPYVFVLTAAVITWLASQSSSRRLLVPVIAVIVVIAGAIVIRGIVLSGYPFYPSTLFAADVDWRVPVAQADVERTFITTHAQSRPTIEMVVPEGHWVPKWLRAILLTNRITLVVPLAIACSLAPLLLRRRRDDPDAIPLHAWLVLWAATFGALVIWFVNAPSGRFAWGYWWILIASLLAKSINRPVPLALVAWPALVLTLAAGAAIWGFRFSRSEAVGFLWPLLFAGVWCTAFLITARRQQRRALGILCLLLGLYPIVDRLSADIVYGRPDKMKWIFWLNASRMPRPEEDFPMPARQTRSGLTVYEAPFSKYESPLPTTPYFNRYLELRKPPDLGGGFRNSSRQPYPLFGYKPGFGFSLPDE